MNRLLFQTGNRLRTFGFATGTGFLTFASCTDDAETDKRPNILLIVADDMGYSDPGCFGGEIETPNINSLASDGLRFTHFYNAGRSWPTRASLMTGYYYQAVQKSSAENRPENWSRSIAHFLSSAGYHCYQSGKWHVGEMPKPHADAGFEHSYLTSNGTSHFVPKDYADDELADVDSTGYYQATAITDRAISMLKGHREQYSGAPFFLYLTYHTPHFPLQAPPGDIEKYRNRYREGWDKLREERLSRLRQLGIADYRPAVTEPQARWIYQDETLLRDTFGPDEVCEYVPWETLTGGQKEFQATKMAIHAAMVDRMDQEIGRMLHQLRESGDFDNTVIFFLSDNGCSTEIMVRGEGHDRNAPAGSVNTHLCLGPGFAAASNTPLRRSKVWVHEGGVSTPLIVHWSKGFRAAGNGLRRTPAHLVDLMPTILELAGDISPYGVAGTDYPALHGKSLLPAFSEDKTVEHDYIYFNHRRNYALRMGEWKIVTSELDGHVWSLYNISEDRGETTDLASVHPGLLQEMLYKWNALTEEFGNQNQNPTQQQIADGVAVKKTE
jgi:arylsulfatase